jgi:hypothetical protein
MNAGQWLKAQRDYWGIEGGLHQSLDASANEDRCRVRTPNAVWVLAMFRRLAISIFQEWKARHPKRKWTTMTDFYTDMSIHNHRRGFLLISARCPSLLPKSS